MTAFTISFTLTNTGYLHDFNNSPLDASLYEMAMGRTVCDKEIGRVCGWPFMNTIINKGIHYDSRQEK